MAIGYVVMNPVARGPGQDAPDLEMEQLSRYRGPRAGARATYASTGSDGVSRPRRCEESQKHDSATICRLQPGRTLNRGLIRPRSGSAEFRQRRANVYRREALHGRVAAIVSRAASAAVTRNCLLRPGIRRREARGDVARARGSRLHDVRNCAVLDLHPNSVSRIVCACDRRAAQMSKG